MKNKVVVIIALGIVLIMGLLVQIARLEDFNKLTQNTKWDKFNLKYQVVNTPAENEINREEAEKYLILYDPLENESVMLANNIIQVIKYMKKNYILCGIKEDSGNYQTYHGVVLAFRNMAVCPDINRIIEYVSKGGRVFFASHPIVESTFEGISHLLGIHALGPMTMGDGIKIVSNILIQGKDYKVDEAFLFNTYLKVKLKKICTVHAVSLEKTPMLWEAPCDKGKFIVFNGTMLDIKINRGLIAGILSLMNDDFIYPIFNVKVCYIDDFPAPEPKKYIKNLSRDYGGSFDTFYRNIWWPNILRIGKLYNIIFNGMVIETYQDRVTPPFKEKFATGSSLLNIYGREILKNGGEIGLHGYNHQPLAEPGFLKEEPGYNSWSSKTNMVAAIKEANRYIGAVFPNYRITCYVPPSNMLSPAGRQALREAMPDLKIIASLYGYNEEFEGGAFIQEFEIGEDGLIDLPRLTYGYENSQINNWAVFNGVSSLGVYSHFIHPDDVDDPERNNHKTWQQLYLEFDRLQKTILDKYRWLRSMTASEAGAAVEKYLDCKVSIEHSENAIMVRCNRFPSEFYFILRTAKKVTVSKYCSAFKIDEGVYLIRATRPVFKIGLRRVK